MSMLTPKHIAIGLTCCIAMAIGTLTLIPLSVPQVIPGTDKIHHVIAFAVLMLPMAMQSPRSLFWLFPTAVVYGGLIEVIQPYVGRFGDIQDFWADFVGVLIGSALGFVIGRLIPTKFRHQDNASKTL